MALFVAGRPIEYITSVPSEHVLVDVTTGQVTVIGELNHGTSYTVEVTATDSGTPRLSSEYVFLLLHRALLFRSSFIGQSFTTVTW